MKRIVSSILSVVLCLTVLSGCGDGNGVSGVQGAGYDASEVVMTIDGREITTDEYRYFIAQSAVTELSSRKPDFDGNFSAVDWNEKVDGDKTLSDVIREKAIDDLKGTVVIANLGSKNGVSLTDDEKSQADTMIGQVKTQQGEEALKLALRQMGVSSEESFKKIYELTTLYSKVEEDFGKERAKYIDAKLEDVLKQYKSEEMITAQHILIMNESEKHSDPKAVIDKVHSRAAAGEDFNALMTEFNEDPGESDGGYTFGKGYMVPEFETAAFALDYNQISDVVQSDYGYHIIKRIVGLAEYRAYLLDGAQTEENTDAINKISVADVMNDIYKVTEELNKIMGGSNNG